MSEAKTWRNIETEITQKNTTFMCDTEAHETLVCAWLDVLLGKETRARSKHSEKNKNPKNPNQPNYLFKHLGDDFLEEEKISSETISELKAWHTIMKIGEHLDDKLEDCLRSYAIKQSNKNGTKPDRNNILIMCWYSQLRGHLVPFLKSQFHLT